MALLSNKVPEGKDMSLFCLVRRLVPQLGEQWGGGELTFPMG